MAAMVVSALMRRYVAMRAVLYGSRA